MSFKRSSHPRCLHLPHGAKQDLHVLFLAKHALGNGSPDPEDGTHATYHHEMLATLRDIGLRVTPANSYRALFEPAGYDFLIPLLNRGGFRNSEMLAPLLAEYHRLPYMGGSAIVRGITDDKNCMKRMAEALGILTPAWKYYPIGGLDCSMPDFEWTSLIVKPNASSASFGLLHTDQWSCALRHIQHLHQQGHDVIVETYIDGYDIADPIVGSVEPWFLPIIEYRGESGDIRTYAQKRDLVHSHTEHVPLTDRVLCGRVRDASMQLTREIWPFDHGRFEYRVDYMTGEPWFIEVNINCNLWSRKTISRSARLLDVSHHELVETIVCNSLLRQGLLAEASVLAA